MENDRIQQGKRSPNDLGTPSATLHKNSRTSEAKRTNKTRSKVWEKVAWFTRRSKNVKEGKTAFDRGKKENEVEVCLNAAESTCLTQQHDHCSACSIRKLKLKQNGSFYKTKSFYNLKRRKDRQLKERTADFNCTEHIQFPVCHCDTATGTFHDFSSDRRVSGRNKKVSSCNVLSEIAREMNCPPKVNAVDIDYSKPNCDRMAVPSCSVERNRCYAFSGPVYNSWPRKKRSNTCPAKDTLSPPIKLKRLGVKKTASFNGFDSLIKSSTNESTPFLSETNQIKNQRGFEIGVIHFYKSPKRQENAYKWEKLGKEDCEQLKEKADALSGSDESHLCQDKLFKSDSKGSLQQCMENLHMGDKEMLLEVMNKSGTPEQLCNISYTHLLDPSYDCEKKNSSDTNIDPGVESENTMESTLYGIDIVPKELNCTRREMSSSLQDSYSKVSSEDYIDKQILNESDQTISNSACSDGMDKKANTFFIES